MDIILEFISKFSDDGSNKQVIKLFTEKCCYWFAEILANRFSGKHPIIVYDIDMCHFGTKIDNRVYDITGDVTDQYDWIPWDEVSVRDSVLAYVVSKNCINLEE